jgi:hypothetical protein
METEKRPIRTTLLFGLMCGLIFIPISMMFKYTYFWPYIFRITIFSYLAVYAVFLSGWGNKKRFAVLFPLLFLFIFILAQNSTLAFLLLSMGMLSWIRSGVCFQDAFAKSMGGEIIFTMGGGALVACFNPHTTITWALGIWLYFMVQSVYFMFMTDLEIVNDVTYEPDAFNQARMRAERALKR